MWHYSQCHGREKRSLRKRQDKTHGCRTPTSFTVPFGRHVINSGGSYRTKKKVNGLRVNKDKFTSVEFISVSVMLRKLVVTLHFDFRLSGF